MLNNHKRHTAALDKWLRRLGATPNPISVSAPVLNTREELSAEQLIGMVNNARQRTLELVG